MGRRLKAWKNVAQSASMRRVRPSWVPRPHAAHFILTYKCNLKCEACPSWEVRDHNDLSLEEWLRVFEQLKSLDVVKVLGGEPLVRKDIVEILTGIREIIDPYMMLQMLYTFWRLWDNINIMRSIHYLCTSSYISWKFYQPVKTHIKLSPHP